MDKFIYDPEKGYMIGLPARDMSLEEWKDYPEKLKKAALNIGLYKKQENKKEEVNNVKRS